MSTIRIVLVDDHTLVRSGLKTLLGEIEAVEVVAEAANGREAIEQVRLYKPDVVLMDISMSDMNGLDAGAIIASEHPEIGIIVLSMHDSHEYVSRALKIGALGYVLKNAAPMELQLALETVVNGGTYLSSGVSRHALEAYVEQRESGQNPGASDILTPRQTEILKNIAEGRSTKQIAFDLGVSIKTIENHRAQIMNRLDIRDVAGLVRYAIRTGLINI